MEERTEKAAGSTGFASIKTKLICIILPVVGIPLALFGYIFLLYLE